jgi:hypothetical protein
LQAVACLMHCMVMCYSLRKEKIGIGEFS